MGVVKDLWIRIEKGGKAFVPARIQGKLPRDTKWVNSPEGWTIARKSQEEILAAQAQSSLKTSGVKGKDDLKRLYLIKANYSLLDAEELLHIQRWISEIIDLKKEEKRKTLAEKISMMQRELSNLK